MAYSKFLIGERYKNNKNQWFEIIGYCTEFKNNHKKRVVKFDSGYETIVSTPNILRGTIIDYGNPTVLGVGYGCKTVDNKIIYRRWYKMLERCYKEDSHNYKWYGGKGVYVCDRWLHFENYLNDVSSMDNYLQLMEYPSKWNIDKDIIKKDNKCYCPKYCRIVEKVANVYDSIDYQSDKIFKRYEVSKFSMSGEFIYTYPSITKASKDNRINFKDIKKCCEGEIDNCGGFVWKYAKEV